MAPIGLCATLGDPGRNGRQSLPRCRWRVQDLVMVVNFDVPNHHEDYVHRVGRTGRAGNKGTAITFIAADEERYAPDLVKALKESGAPVPQASCPSALSVCLIGSMPHCRVLQCSGAHAWLRWTESGRRRLVRRSLCVEGVACCVSSKRKPVSVGGSHAD
jgi:Helicase conserved C-terminal domain